MSSLPSLHRLGGEVVEALVADGSGVRIPQGWTTIHQQGLADKAYLVLDGRLCVVSDGCEVSEIARGGLAGEMGSVNHRLRTERLRAETSVEVLAWPADVFQRLRADHVAFDAFVRETAADRCKE